MKPLQSVDELLALHEQMAARPAAGTAIRVCSTGCRAAGALDVCEALAAEIARRNLQQRARVVRTGCHGLCAGAVALVIDPGGIFYQKVTPDDAAEIIEKTVLEGKVIRRLCWRSGKRSVPLQQDIPFYKRQRRLVLRNCGVVDPQSIEDCLAGGAYLSAAKALAKMSPEEVINEVAASGLRGRGGAGFPTGRKWQFARAGKGQPKYVVCNADEGDPGAFMDRALLEGDPHLIIEGMVVGAYAIGATQGFVYVRDEYPVAIEHTRIAVSQARQAGLLGKDVLGAGFDFDIEVVKGAGAYVCGEETALLDSIEGKRGHPRARPPFPASFGLHGKPTNVNNVETWANVPRIIEMGSAAYAEIGNEDATGTKIFSLAGTVNNAGLVEVPLGTTLRQIIFDIGGGTPRGREFKAAQIGGPCGGFVARQHLDRPIDYASLKDLGAMMGCGGIIVIGSDTCMVDIARVVAEFAQKESCGKCVPCRIGTKRIVETLTRITNGQGEVEDIARLEKLCQLIDQTSLCGMAPNPVLSTIRYFRDEYEDHIRRRRCPTNTCEALAAAARCGSS